MASKTICHCINVRRMGNRLTAFYNRCLEPAGLTVSQYSLLMCINAMAPVSVSDLSKPLDLDRTTLVRSLKLLESSELVCDSAARGRAKQLVLTQKGEEALARARDLWEQAQRAFEEILGEQRLAMFNELADLIDGIDA